MNKKASYAFRILAGAYLVYLGYSLIKGYLVEHEVSAGFMAVGILFGAAGLFFCVTGLLGRRQADKELKEAQEEYDRLSKPQLPEASDAKEEMKENTEEEET